MQTNDLSYQRSGGNQRRNEKNSKRISVYPYSGGAAAATRKQHKHQTKRRLQAAAAAYRASIIKAMAAAIIWRHQAW